MISDPLSLAPGVVVFPVGELPSAARKLAGRDACFALTRMNARGTTKLIDAEVAALLEKFRSPCRFVDAVVELSAEHGLDPRSLLGEMFPIVRRLRSEGLLRTAGAPEPGFTPLGQGDVIGGFTVLRCVQAFDDCAVYQARAPDGRVAAVKFAVGAEDAAARQALVRESRVLASLKGPCFPRLLVDATDEDEAFLALEWLDGEASNAWADRVRRPWSREGQDRLFDGVIAIVEAYAELHRQRVVHGDVHPRNVLICRRDARILDFSLSRCLGDPSFPEPGRGGVFPFYEPEWATAILTRVPLPPATECSDQYALATLLYLVLTGHHGLAMRGDTRAMLDEIVSGRPAPFDLHGVPGWPEVERVLVRALAKAPGDRFSSTGELAVALREAADLRPAARRAPTPTALLDAAEARLGRRGGLLDLGLPKPPYASVNYGAAGVAYFWYRLGVLRGEPEHLLRGLRWLDYARRARRRPDAFGNRDLRITPETVGTTSLYHGPAGLHCVSALIFNSLGNLDAVASSASAFVLECRRSSERLDLVSGRASSLVGAALLAEAFGQTELAQSTGLESLGDDEIAGIWRRLGDQTLDEGELSSWGIAHGWAGVLYATVRWCEAAGRSLPSKARERLDELGARRQQSGPQIWWLGPGDLGLQTAWCHGTAGYAHLWAAAHRVTGDPRYRTLCLGAAEHCWLGTSPDGSLCCGAAGQAYAMLVAHCADEDRKWLDRARELARRSLRSAGTPSSHTNSLYKGDVGMALLAEELRQPDAAAMPLVGSEKWPRRPGNPRIV